MPPALWALPIPWPNPTLPAATCFCALTLLLIHCLSLTLTGTPTLASLALSQDRSDSTRGTCTSQPCSQKVLLKTRPPHPSSIPSTCPGFLPPSLSGRRIQV